MTDDRKSGLAFLAGSLGGIVTMAIHPTAGGPMNASQVDRLVVASGSAHSLAMVSFLVMFLGAIGLSSRLAASEVQDKRDYMALAALVAYGFGVVALLLATAVSGFIVPNIMRHMVRDVTANAPQWSIVIDAVFQFNQAFARIYSVAASTAVLLWSTSALKNGSGGDRVLGRGIAIYGCAVAAILTALIVVGHLRLNVHGMAVVVAAHAIWFVVAGVQLYRRPEPEVV